MKAFHIKYASVDNPLGERIDGSRNNGPFKARRRRVWRGPRFYPGSSIRLSGTAKALARLAYDKTVKDALA
jgi:hypothetical protein